VNIWISLANAVDVVASRLGTTDPEDRRCVELSARITLREALAYRMISAEGQPAEGGFTCSPEYQPIPDGWWANYYDAEIISAIPCDPGTHLRILGRSVVDWRRGIISFGRASPLKQLEFHNVRIWLDDIDRLWSPPGRALIDSILPSGSPGRPSSSAHLIGDEFNRRAAAGDALPTLAREASALLDWLIARYPKAQRPKSTTIENNIRAAHRRYKTKQSSS
jgi:hypothetical protein